MRIYIEYEFRIDHTQVDDFAEGPKYWIFGARGRKYAYSLFVRKGEVILRKIIRGELTAKILFHWNKQDKP
jgi:hypothetical protein